LGSPPGQPALVELIIQVDCELEDFPGGLLPRKPPGAELPPEILFDFLSGKKGLGGLGSPPGQPALEELIIQVDYELEDLPGGLLPRKPPGGELPPEKLLEF
jgi:hypothetical protein